HNLSISHELFSSDGLLPERHEMREFPLAHFNSRASRTTSCAGSSRSVVIVELMYRGLGDLSPAQFLECRQTNWRGRLPRYEEQSLRHRSAHTIDLCSLTQQSLPKQRVAGAGGEQALVDDPGERFDARASQVFLQSIGLRHGRGLCQ